MKCEVLLFAQLRETIGRERLALELDANATVDDALDALSRAHPIIRSMRAIIAVAVDQQYQPPSARLRDGCTMALIPPVSGG